MLKERRRKGGCSRGFSGYFTHSLAPSHAHVVTLAAHTHTHTGQMWESAFDSLKLTWSYKRRDRVSEEKSWRALGKEWKQRRVDRVKDLKVKRGQEYLCFLIQLLNVRGLASSGFKLQSFRDKNDAGSSSPACLLLHRGKSCCRRKPPAVDAAFFSTPPEMGNLE